MAEITSFPKYVTDGAHIYLWHPEYEQLLADGKLKPSDPPAQQKNKPMSARQKTKLNEARKKALVEAERAVLLLKQPAQEEIEDTEDVISTLETTGTPAGTGKEINLDE